MLLLQTLFEPYLQSTTNRPVSENRQLNISFTLYGADSLWTVAYMILKLWTIEKSTQDTKATQRRQDPSDRALPQDL